MAVNYFLLFLVFPVPILGINTILYFIVASIAAWAAAHGIERSHETVLALHAQPFPIYYPFGNTATGLVVFLSLLAGVVGITTSVTGIYNHFKMKPPNSHATAASSLVSLSLTLLAMGFACKEINIGWTGSTLRTLEIVLIIVSGTQIHAAVSLTSYSSYLEYGRKRGHY